MKSYKRNIIIIMSLSISSLIISIILGFSEKIGICMVNERTCLNTVDLFIEPMFLISISIILILSILFFISENFYHSWKRFALIFLPLGIISILLAPSLSRDPLFNFDKQFFTLATSGLFFIISLLIIFYQWFKLHRVKEKK